MSRKERIALNIGIWLCVYPSVLFITAIFKWLELDLALWLEILLSTALTVPLISYLAVPAVRKIMATAEGKHESELRDG
jgi:antibiotic biosynthesis monooxygenase (ABM) superfamily enzyme